MIGSRLKQKIRDAWRKLSRLDARPDQIAAGFTIGIVAGLLPFNPSPIVTATVVAWLMKRNVIATVAGGAATALYIPLLPLIWLGEYRLGALVLPVQHPLSLERAGLWEVAQQGWDVYAAMLVGSIVIAAPTGLATYFAVRRLARRWAWKRTEAKRSA
jgi:uncharacterized protein (DUF2062 family)